MRFASGGAAAAASSRARKEPNRNNKKIFTAPGTEKTFLHSATISKLLPLDSRGTAHQHNTTRREEEIPEDSVIRLGPGCMSQGPGCISLPL